MHRFTATLFTLGLLGVSSCTALQDLDQFQPDFSCGVDIRLRNYFPHAQEPGSTSDISQRSATRERFGVYVVQERMQPSGQFERFYVARAFLDPLPAPNVDLRLPFAIAASETGDELPATLELHADRQTLRSGADFFEISEIPMDHSWVFPHACGAEGTVFPHISDFDQLEPATEGAFGLKIRPTGGPAAQFWVDNTIEVRVVREAIIGGQEVDQARAFYRRAGATDIENAGLDDAEIDLGGVLREDEDVTVIVFVDRNGNGLFDSTGALEEQDIAIDTTLTLSSAALSPCDLPISPCIDEDDVIIEVSLQDIRESDPTLIQEAWWTYVAPE